MARSPIADEAPVDDRVPQLKAAPLETCDGPIERPVTHVLAALDEREDIARSEQLVDVIRIVLPVCCNAQGATRFQPVGYECQKIRLQQPSLVVPFLRPRIGKVEVDTIE